MLHTLTFRVFLLSVATSACIMALDAFKKICDLQTCTPAVVDGVSGMTSLFCACARMELPAAARYFRIAEPKSSGQHEKDSHRIHIRESYRIRG